MKDTSYIPHGVTSRGQRLREILGKIMAGGIELVCLMGLIFHLYLTDTLLHPLTCGLHMLCSARFIPWV